MAIDNAGSSSNRRQWSDDDQSRLQFATITVACWVYENSQPGNVAFICWANSVGDWRMGIDSGSANKFRFRLTLDNSTVFNAIESGTHSTGVWYHVACRWDGTTQTLWRDGAIVATTVPGAGHTLHTSPAGSSAAYMITHMADNGGTATSDSRLAGLGYWGIDLTDWEIAQLARGADPLTIRAGNLLICDRLDVTSTDLIRAQRADAGHLIQRPPPPKLCLLKRRSSRIVGKAGSAAPPPSTNSQFWFAAALAA